MLTQKYIYKGQSIHKGDALARPTGGMVYKGISSDILIQLCSDGKIPITLLCLIVGKLNP